jgi:DNA-binding NtrC family response regulator
MIARILIVDDEQSMCELLEADLNSREFETTWFTAAEDAFAALKDQHFDVVLTDLKMPDVDGIQLCERIVANRPDIPVVVMTAFGSLETAVQAIRAGAYDFITKPVEMAMLALTLQRAAKHRALQEKVKILSQAVEESKRFDNILGASVPMQKLYDQLSRIADSETSVLITGESGTGKEMVARAVHNKSRRSAQPFVAVNCAALPETLIESELFGHAKGAFTDARSERKGLFLQAEGGTLFLDEIGDLPVPMQAKLLRALEERQLRPVGGDSEVPFDLRLITATNRDLETAVEEQRFREDLFFRINVIQVDLPPLRARGADILLLAQHFAEVFAARADKQITGMSDAVAEKFLAYSWPGNIRELRNAIEHAVALARYDKLAVEDLPEKVRDYSGRSVVLAGDDPTELVPLEDVERRYILHVLDAVSGNKTLAARTLGLDRKTLYRKLNQYGVTDTDK